MNDSNLYSTLPNLDDWLIIMLISTSFTDGDESIFTEGISNFMLNPLTSVKYAVFAT